MTVQVVENWAVIAGRIDELNPHGELNDYLSATIDVTDVRPDSGYPNLFSWAVGNKISINIPKKKADQLSLSVGDAINSRVRKSGPTSAFVDPDSLQKQG